MYSGGFQATQSGMLSKYMFHEYSKIRRFRVFQAWRIHVLAVPAISTQPNDHNFQNIIVDKGNRLSLHIFLYITFMGDCSFI